MCHSHNSTIYTKVCTSFDEGQCDNNRRRIMPGKVEDALTMSSIASLIMDTLSTDTSGMTVASGDSDDT